MPYVAANGVAMLPDGDTTIPVTSHAVADTHRKLTQVPMPPPVVVPFMLNEINDDAAGELH